MTDDEVEVVARAIARARRSSPADNRRREGAIAISEQHRELARLAILTLERHRALQQAKRGLVWADTGHPGKA